MIKMKSRALEHDRRQDLEDLLSEDTDLIKPSTLARLKAALDEGECIAYQYHLSGVVPKIMLYSEALKEYKSKDKSLPRIVKIVPYSDL